MADKSQTLLTKYLQVLGKTAGKENDNIRAKIAWSLAQDFWEALELMPDTIQDLNSYLNARIQADFPFCESLELKEISPAEISVVVRECVLKQANSDVMNNYDQNLCPVEPLLIFFLSRTYGQNVHLIEDSFTEDGCIMKLSLGNSNCACRSE